MEMSKILEGVNKNLEKFGMKPLHPCTLCFYYMPMKGSLSYALLGTQMMCPELYENFSFLVIPKYISLTNSCLVNSILGSSLYLYSRPHLLKAPPTERISYCLFGSCMFNLGSMLLWALGRTVAPESSGLRFFIGLSGAVGTLWLANKYIDFVDSQLPENKAHKK